MRPILFIDYRLPDLVIPAKAGIQTLPIIINAIFSAIFNCNWYNYLHLQLNHGKSLDPAHRDVLQAKIIRSAINQDIRKKVKVIPAFFDYF